MAISVQTLSEIDRRLVAVWAADCAERVLPLFEAECRDDERGGLRNRLVFPVSLSGQRNGGRALTAKASPFW